MTYYTNSQQNDISFKVYFKKNFKQEKINFDDLLPPHPGTDKTVIPLLPAFPAFKKIIYYYFFILLLLLLKTKFMSILDSHCHP